MKVLGQHPLVPFTLTKIEDKSDLSGTFTGVFESLDGRFAYKGVKFYRNDDIITSVEKIEGGVSYDPVEKIGEVEIPKKKSKKFRVVLEYEVAGNTTWTDEKFMKTMKYQFEREYYGNYNDSKVLGLIGVEFADDEQ